MKSSQIDLQNPDFSDDSWDNASQILEESDDEIKPGKAKKRQFIKKEFIEDEGRETSHIKEEIVEEECQRPRRRLKKTS